MQLHHLGKSSFVKATFAKAAIATVALSGLLFFAGAPSAQAADRDDEHRRVVNSERHFSYEDRGYYHRDADNWRDQHRQTFERRYNDYRNSEYRDNWNRDRDDRRYQRDRDRD